MITEVKIQELTKKVRMLVDNELTKEDERELLKEIKDNPTIMDLLKREQFSSDILWVEFF